MKKITFFGRDTLSESLNEAGEYIDRNNDVCDIDCLPHNDFEVLINDDVLYNIIDSDGDLVIEYMKNNEIYSGKSMKDLIDIYKDVNYGCVDFIFNEFFMIEDIKDRVKRYYTKVKDKEDIDNILKFLYSKGGKCVNGKDLNWVINYFVEDNTFVIIADEDYGNICRDTKYDFIKGSATENDEFFRPKKKSSKVWVGLGLLTLGLIIYKTRS